MAANALNRKIKQCLGWLGQQEGKTHVKVKALTHNNDLHTSIGMLSYCSKDMGKEHYDEIRKGVTDEMLERGKEIYSVLGNKDFKERVCLTKDNIFERAFIFWLYSRSVQRYHTVPFITILRKMLQSGNYYLSAEWVTKSSEGMNPERAEAFWQILCSKKDGGPLIQDLEVALFSQKNSGTHRYFTNLSAQRAADSRIVHRFIPQSEVRFNTCYRDEGNIFWHHRTSCKCSDLPPFMD